MANFKIALDKVLSREGGYINDPDDKGGETYKGISRKYNPDWKGWRIIDNTKKNILKILKVILIETQNLKSCL